MSLSSSDTGVTTVLEQLAGFAIDQRHARLDDEVIHAAARATVDWCGATIAGSAIVPVDILRHALLDQPTRGSARLIPTEDAVPVRTAALINGTASHTE